MSVSIHISLILAELTIWNWADSKNCLVDVHLMIKFSDFQNNPLTSS